MINTIIPLNVMIITAKWPNKVIILEWFRKIIFLEQSLYGIILQYAQW
jgi:hypothetical protein